MCWQKRLLFRHEWFRLLVDEDRAVVIEQQEQARQDMIAQEQAEAIRKESEEKSALHDEKMSKIDKDKQNLDVKLVTELNKEEKEKKDAKSAK